MTTKEWKDAGFYEDSISDEKFESMCRILNLGIKLLIKKVDQFNTINDLFRINKTGVELVFIPILYRIIRKCDIEKMVDEDIDEIFTLLDTQFEREIKKMIDRHNQVGNIDYEAIYCAVFANKYINIINSR